MKVIEAINLMVKNPAVDFPWRASIYQVVNEFLPKDRQLDPCTAEATELRDAVAALEASTQKMLHESRLTLTDTVPQLVCVPQPENNEMKTRSAVFFIFGVTVCACALILSVKAGGVSGVEVKDIVELLKLLITEPSIAPTD